MMYYFDSPFVFVDEIENKENIKKQTLELINIHIENDLCYHAPDHGNSITNFYLNSTKSTFKFDQNWNNEVVWKPIEKMLDQLKKDRDIPVRPKSGFIKDIWFNKYTIGTYATPHVHYASDISGVYVVENKDSEHTSTNFKQDTNVGSWMYGEMSYASKAQEGNVILFPSHLTHWINPVKDERIIVAFDVVFEK